MTSHADLMKSYVISEDWATMYLLTDDKVVRQEFRSEDTIVDTGEFGVPPVRIEANQVEVIPLSPGQFMKVKGSYTTPRSSIEVQDGDVIITAAGKQQTVPSSEHGVVQIEDTSVDPRNDGAPRTLTPKFTVSNFGELEVRYPNE